MEYGLPHDQLKKKKKKILLWEHHLTVLKKNVEILYLTI